MSEEIINGIDVSEEIRYCNNCSNLGLDFKAHKFYCSLSHRPDELPEVLSCDEFSTNCYIKRLQEENKELKKRQITKNGFICDCEQNAKYRQALEEIKKWVTNHNPCDIEADINCTKEDCFECLNYDIKKITKVINEVLDES